MAILKTLENIPTEKLLEVFNLSFSDYVVPFCLTKEQLEDKIKSNSIKLEFSVGAFEDNQLIAFILHGYDIINNLKIVYNAGTGVIPAKRGNKLTVKLYEYILPILRKNDIDKLLLEVITTNEPAIKTYKNIGFKIIRELNCYKGSLNITHTNNDFEIRKLEVYDWQKLNSFWNLKPSWQNSVTAVEKLKNANISIGIYDEEKLLGYTIFNPKIKRIHQLSVDKNYRRKGVGGQLLKHISTNYGKNVSAINIDSTSEETLKFFKDIGMDIYIKQYEMELPLK
ncbi:GNAT family N-acetyltransferase [Chryseobacterium sp. G0201]|uniref:GNAT family N-acetyltransferase n=1 Tax=Chryseobacterium sp. G0201 TaxID=2487065 RepID=UPI000F513AEB|nr:GNAT family N-acetyltransferase [Chryseobacterium sp. G0201]AZA53893.1 GNAT family N-acetyltransferase [Chryseobacterium sp. G0201]